jgi:hypothetical protein
MKKVIIKTFVCLLHVALFILICGESYVWANSLPETATLWANGKVAGYIMLAVMDLICCAFCAIPIIIINSEE